ncbi:hypothetical protein G7068_06825 [Leucobacter viscericola]|uniref:Uncharacterized protein n=1 Tax=Leucobacter viscericola TaxID=2714935 RepID=A0A6G7XEZ7_9MICO|nr:hypothetical protein [Leucobacter viscericola]QIK62941.1 hypothetical protein G7068_06825 [Leucobacter viscericola]
MSAKDSAGMSFGEVEAMSMEEQFDLAGVRYTRMMELVTETQSQIYDGPWVWLGAGLGLSSGLTAMDPVEGATVHNSYYYNITRSFDPPGATGAEADLEPAAKFFASKGWQTEQSKSEDEDGKITRRELRAVTEDGYHVWYTVQANGQYNVDVWSGVYWCDDYAKLTDEVIYRIPKEKFPPPGEKQTVPGEFIEFPKWSDPKVWKAEL